VNEERHLNRIIKFKIHNYNAFDILNAAVVIGVGLPSIGT